MIRDQKCLTILEVAADWHELMIPSIACISEQLGVRFAESRPTTIPIRHN